MVFSPAWRYYSLWLIKPEPPRQIMRAKKRPTLEEGYQRRALKQIRERRSDDDQGENVPPLLVLKLSTYYL